VRARLCELLAPGAGIRATDSAFTVGLLSICDALLDCSLDEVVSDLPLAPEIRDAIVRRGGPLGELLERAVAAQHGKAPPDSLEAHLFYDAVRWADEQLGRMAAPGDGPARAGGGAAAG
jgi:EAL and modified HD-GYP domain-containing signal transduction protein